MSAPAVDGRKTTAADDTPVSGRSDFLERTDTGSFPALSAAPAPFMRWLDDKPEPPVVATPKLTAPPALADLILASPDDSGEAERFDPLTDPFPALDTDEAPDTPLYESARSLSQKPLDTPPADGDSPNNPTAGNSIIFPAIQITAPGRHSSHTGNHLYGRHCFDSFTANAQSALPSGNNAGRHRL